MKHNVPPFQSTFLSFVQRLYGENLNNQDEFHHKFDIPFSIYIQQEIIGFSIFFLFYLNNAFYDSVDAICVDILFAFSYRNSPLFKPKTPGEIRTPDFLVRSQTLCPTELRVLYVEMPHVNHRINHAFVYLGANIMRLFVRTHEAGGIIRCYHVSHDYQMRGSVLSSLTKPFHQCFITNHVVHLMYREGPVGGILFYAHIHLCRYPTITALLTRSACLRCTLRGAGGCLGLPR